MNIKNILFFFFIVNASCFFSQTQNDGLIPSEFENKIFQMTDRILSNPNFQVGSINADSIPTLPIGICKPIGKTIFCIAIDSAFFKQDKAYFNAYMALDFPGATRKLAFAGKGINFNPSGVLFGEGVRLHLVSDATLNLGPNVKLFLKGDGSNYIEFDCNGYKRTHFKGEFRFKKGILEPTTAGAEYVTATVDVTLEDIQNLYASVTFSPFMVKGLKDYKFNVSEASVDLSDFQNPSATLPTSFTEALGSGGDQNLWRGFYLKNLTVTLPKKVSNKNTGATQFGVNNLFIDDSGVTGLAFGNNVLSIEQGSMAGWGLSIKRIEIGLQSNVLVRGYMKGEIAIPVLEDDTLGYTALVARSTTDSTDLDYSFSIGIADTMELDFNALSSKLYVFPNSVLNVTDNNERDEFIPTLTLNGKYSIISGKAKIDRVGYQNLVLTTRKPYLMSATFSLIPDSAHVANFPISISQISFGYNQDTSKLALAVTLGLNLGDAASTVEFSANTTLIAYARTYFGDSLRPRFQFESIGIGDIDIEVTTSPFYLRGLIIFKENDPVFGKLFYGSVEFRLNNIMNENAVLKAGFGKIKRDSLNYKYWFVEGQVPVNITMGQLTITKFIGGASYHVEPTRDTLQLIALAKEQINPNPVSAIPFIPNVNKGVSFLIGAGFKHTLNEEIVNGDASLRVSFNANGGFSDIKLNANCYMLVDIAHRYDETVENRIDAKATISYDYPTRKFQANITGFAKFQNAIYSTLAVNLLIAPNDWHFWFNTPQSPATVSVRNGSTELFSATGYLMFGQSLAPLATLPDWAVNISGVSSTRSINNQACSTGSGLAFGLNFAKNFQKDYFLGHWEVGDYYLYLNMDMNVGFDLTVLKYAPDKICSETGNSFGMNNRYCSGNLYFKFHAVGGGRREGKNHTQHVEVFDVNLTALLTGEFPKPTHLKGNVSAEVKIFGKNFGTYPFEFEIGNKCTVI